MRKTTTLLTPAHLLALLLLTAWLLGATGCQKDPLPKATREGRNIFGCKINGKPWVPDGGTGFQADKPISGGVYEILTTPRSIGIWIRAVSKDKQEIHLHLRNINPGVYKLDKDTQVIPISIFPKDYGFYRRGEATYSTSSLYTGHITVTKSDTSSGILSGTFEFAAGNSSETTYQITEGRFDINSRKL